MCTVWIVLPDGGLRVVDSAILEPRARMGQVWKQWMEPLRKTVVKKQKMPVANALPAQALAPLQCGGDREKTRSNSYWSEKDTRDHYRERCNVANDRRKTCGLRKRRLQIECW